VARGTGTSEASKVSEWADRGASGAVLKHLQWMRLRGLSDATVYQRALYLRRLAAHLDVELGDDLLMVDSADLEDWQDTLAGLAPGSRHNAVVNMREFYAWAVRSKLLQETPTGGLVLAKMPRRLPRPIAEADLQLAIASAPPRLRLMLVLAAFCGLRAMELAQLDREDVKETLATPLLIVRGKGDKERIVPLSSRVLLELHMHDLPQRGPVFPRGDGQGGRCEPWTISQLCNSVLHDVGIPDTLHSLRHYFGTVMYAVSKDLLMVGATMGHNSPRTTAGYAAWSPAAAAAAVEAMAGAASATVFPLRAVAGGEG